MRFSIIAALSSLLLATSAIAGNNCKCQDAGGQYNDATHFCCDDPQTEGNDYKNDQVHQCSNYMGQIDSGRFVRCCIGEGHGGAYCWN